MNFFNKKELKVILWSHLDEGKTSLLYNGFKRIKDMKVFPTVGANLESVIFNKINIIFYDIGGGCAIKDLRNNYFNWGDVILFLIDSSQSFDEKYNIEEFQKCIKIIQDKPLLIVITKIDIRKVSTLDIIKVYQLDSLFQRKSKFGIIECSSFTSQGIKEIEYWLASIVK